MSIIPVQIKPFLSLFKENTEVWINYISSLTYLREFSLGKSICQILKQNQKDRMFIPLSNYKILELERQWSRQKKLTLLYQYLNGNGEKSKKLGYFFYKEYLQLIVTWVLMFLEWALK
jgi:hypothetical protein